MNDYANVSVAKGEISEMADDTERLCIVNKIYFDELVRGLGDMRSMMEKLISSWASAPVLILDEPFLMKCHDLKTDI